jgi:hypothetical protein
LSTSRARTHDVSAATLLPAPSSSRAGNGDRRAGNGMHPISPKLSMILVDGTGWLV